MKIEINKNRIREIFTPFIASAFTHHEKIVREPWPPSDPPTTNEAKIAYLNNPTIQAFTDVTVSGIYEILSVEGDHEKK